MLCPNSGGLNEYDTFQVVLARLRPLVQLPFLPRVIPNDEKLPLEDTPQSESDIDEEDKQEEDDQNDSRDPEERGIQLGAQQQRRRS